ncbi:amino acid deaminase [Sphaerisporangium fuscum]|uniref:amino acid deaminase n=1 Tax=Sphaerisporangium fuscum TaxID=2835868 RepID=UPI001BDC2E56|nr:amino acid deaminase [Sphaerisporangium fuscum]
MGIDAEAVGALRGERLDWRFKALPAGVTGTVADFLATGPTLAEFGTPLLTLDEPALAHNIALMAGWAARAGAVLMPHGKSTMAPRLWQRQIEAGAWGLTLANLPQLRVARAFGVRRLMLAAALPYPAGLAWIRRELEDDPDFHFICWADSVRSVEIMDAALRDTPRPVDVCVELGAPGGRTGARTAAEAEKVAQAVRAAPALRLAGVAGYEGSFGHDATPASLAAVRRYLEGLADLFGRLDHETAEPIVTAGGSAYFDQVVDVLGGLPARLVLRSGAYVIHDDGFYRAISPLRETTPFRPAMHGWARVISRPEPGLALLDAGKRDLPFDEGLPEPQHVRGRGELKGARVTALNDQHTYLELDAGTDLECGDVVRLGLSHPCTAMDKWSLIPVVDGEVVVDLLRTYF